MKKKKRIIMCCAAASLFLVSCDSNQSLTSSKADRLVTSKLTIGSPIFEPYFYVGQDGMYTGVDQKIAQEACRRMGYEADFEEIVWGERDRLLDSGTIDCIWGCFVMDGRENRYQWAGPYLTSELAAVVAADSDILSAKDLSGKAIAVRIDSKSEDFLRGRIDGVERVVPETLFTFNSMMEAFVWFGKGYADAVVDHRAALKVLTQQNPQLYRVLDDHLDTVNLGVAFRTDFDSDIVAALNTALDEMNKDGTIARIAKEYHLGDEEAQKESADGEN